MAANYEAGVTYGERAWHGEDENRSADDSRRFSVEETIKAGLDWSVAKKPLAIASTEGDIAGTMAEGVFGVFRTDRWQCLGAVGSDYECLQNRDIFEQFQPFLDAGQLSFESCGSLDEGRRVFVQARLCQEDTDIGGGDTIAPMLLIASSHDGSLATRVGFTPVRVVCQNTLSAAVSRGGLLKIRHTKSQTAALDAVMKTCDVARQEFAATCEQYKQLQRLPIDRKTLEAYVRRVLEVKDGEKMSSRKARSFDRIIRNALYGRGQSASELTAWSAYNGVTEWTTHSRQSDAKARQKSVWFGASAETNRKALGLALAIAS